MSVVPLTLTISLCLVFTFVLFFLREYSRRPFSGAERESLLPLDDETPRIVAGASERLPVAEDQRHAHGAGHVCHGNGSCASCLHRATRRAAQAPV
ncbi:hypothetical protein [Rariglobus hedericola]|uniref:Uncharacterized protein n=1 Tax=Rariglobus hedericola TaxID=2597822 RepID=A0A556QRC7_9BACT|nr:hypothetical protein [Rariglobus hedericola]TSJ79200.1 hypothetical protein FPL22_07875 [Rariglobus hedericola]